jgi:hypothetical protein
VRVGRSDSIRTIKGERKHRWEQASVGSDVRACRGEIRVSFRGESKQRWERRWMQRCEQRSQ